MRLTALRATAALLLGLAVACSDDSTPASPPPPTPSLQDGLWTGSGSQPAILRVDPTELSGTGNQNPATTLTTSSARLNTLLGVAFDASGNLWVASLDDSLLLAFQPGDLTSSGPKAPTRVISSRAGSLTGPSGLAFDAHHNLWVVDNGTGTLDRYDPAQQAAGGAQAPAVVLRLPGDPTAIAFDAAGSLWVSDNFFHLIVKYSAAQLTTSDSPAPVVVLTDTAHSLVNPVGMAFDAAGNLWVANSGNQTLVAFSPAQQAAGGALVPHITLSSAAGSLSIPVGLAFDAEGNLWVIGGAGSLTRFSAASLAASGAPTPSARLHITGHSVFWSLAFWPKPAGLPLN